MQNVTTFFELQYTFSRALDMVLRHVYVRMSNCCCCCCCCCCYHHRCWWPVDEIFLQVAINSDVLLVEWAGAYVSFAVWQLPTCRDITLRLIHYAAIDQARPWNVCGSEPRPPYKNTRRTKRYLYQKSYRVQLVCVVPNTPSTYDITRTSQQNCAFAIRLYYSKVRLWSYDLMALYKSVYYYYYYYTQGDNDVILFYVYAGWFFLSPPCR